MNNLTGFEKVKSNQGAVLLSCAHYINQSICKAYKCFHVMGRVTTT